MTSFLDCSLSGPSPCLYTSRLTNHRSGGSNASRAPESARPQCTATPESQLRVRMCSLKLKLGPYASEPCESRPHVRPIIALSVSAARNVVSFPRCGTVRRPVSFVLSDSLGDELALWFGTGESAYGLRASAVSFSVKVSKNARREARVPPEGAELFRAVSRTFSLQDNLDAEVHLLQPVAGQDHFARLGCKLGTVVLDERPDAQVRWGRLDADFRKEHATCLLCNLLVLFDHACHEGHLPCDVEVVCAILSASFECLGQVSLNTLALGLPLHPFTYMLSMQPIRSDSREQDEGFLGQCTQIIAIQAARLNFCSTGQHTGRSRSLGGERADKMPRERGIHSPGCWRSGFNSLSSSATF